ncbi:hypothetical protein K505DRAFT_333660 [Melanomma pulvis-pyrius CBS 109.77]|uniref:Uncharacterized protein n=1 Tax=Melanomma pulvis-pyrius CBS 109.77 TaxID=1314802 RepID=A0A6A6XPL8_9PLEO|nr:hypothetical protein K505DRAFT_333660 [Melanomma pulvis-pyrius CBS 109.77]
MERAVGPGDGGGRWSVGCWVGTPPGHHGWEQRGLSRGIWQLLRAGDAVHMPRIAAAIAPWATSGGIHRRASAARSVQRAARWALHGQNRTMAIHNQRSTRAALGRTRPAVTAARSAGLDQSRALSVPLRGPASSRARRQSPYAALAALAALAGLPLPSRGAWPPAPSTQYLTRPAPRRDDALPPSRCPPSLGQS